MKNILKKLEVIMDIFHESPGIRGMLGYVIFIACWLVLFPDNPDFAVELANHLPYFFVYMIGGMAVMDVLSYIMEKMRRRKPNSKET